MGLRKSIRRKLSGLQSTARGRDADADHPHRFDLRRFKVCTDFLIDVFWKDLPHGSGPALSCYVIGHEVLKFDCFGKDKGHMHIQSAHHPGVREHRLFFPEATREAQIERSLFEVVRNLDYHLQRHPDAGVREFVVDHGALERQLPEISKSLAECLVLSDAAAADATS